MTEEPPALAVSARLDRIEAKLDRLIGGPTPDVVSVKQAMPLVGVRTYSSFYRVISSLGVRPFLQGKYRRAEIENAVAKQALRARISAQNKIPNHEY